MGIDVADRDRGEVRCHGRRTACVHAGRQGSDQQAGERYGGAWGARAGDTTRSEALSRLDLAPGRYQIRIGAQRKSDGVAGSVFADVEVPNATKAALTMFDVFLGRTPAEGASASKIVGAADAALAPTTQRTFDRTDKVDAFVTLAEGGSAALRPATVRITVTDSLGHDVSVQDVPARAEDFQSGSRSWGRKTAASAGGTPRQANTSSRSVRRQGRKRRSAGFESSFAAGDDVQCCLPPDAVRHARNGSGHQRPPDVLTPT